MYTAAMLKKRSPLFTLFVIILLDMLGLGILIPVMPVLLTDPSSPHYMLAPGTTKEAGYLILGVLFTLFSFGQFLASPIIGQFSDKWGRKRLLAFSVLGTSISHFLFAIGIMITSIPLLIFARLFAGITGGNIVVAQAAIADITTPENRAKNFGLIGAAFGLGFILGPFVGGKLTDTTLVSWFSATTPFFFAALLSLINVVQVLYFLEETNRTKAKDKVIEWGRSLRNIAHAYSMPRVKPLFITNFLFQGGFAFYTTFAAVYLLSKFHFSENDIGNYFAFVGIWIVITQGFITRKISAYFTEAQIVKNTIMLAGLCILGVVLVQSAFALYLLVPFFAISIGLSQANITALISRSAGANIQGEILGVNGSVMALAQTIPPVISGVAAVYFEPQAPLIIASVFVILAGIYFNNHLRGLRLSHS